MGTRDDGQRDNIETTIKAFPLTGMYCTISIAYYCFIVLLTDSMPRISACVILSISHTNKFESLMLKFKIECVEMFDRILMKNVNRAKSKAFKWSFEKSLVIDLIS